MAALPIVEDEGKNLKKIWKKFNAPRFEHFPHNPTAPGALQQPSNSIRLSKRWHRPRCLWVCVGCSWQRNAQHTGECKRKKTLNWNNQRNQHIDAFRRRRHRRPHSNLTQITGSRVSIYSHFLVCSVYPFSSAENIRFLRIEINNRKTSEAWWKYMNLSFGFPIPLKSLSGTLSLDCFAAAASRFNCDYSMGS